MISSLKTICESNRSQWKVFSLLGLDQNLAKCFNLNFFKIMTLSPYGNSFCFHLFMSLTLNYYRYKEETDQSYFEGTGYASLKLKEQNLLGLVRYEQTIETTADEGIVFFAANGVIRGMLLSVLWSKNIF